MKRISLACLIGLTVAVEACGGAGNAPPASGITVVPHEKLLEFLPTLPGWSQERTPQGDTDTAENFSRVQVNYAETGGIGGLSIEISDTAMNVNILRPLQEFLDANTEEKTGDPMAPVTVTPTKVAGFPARQEWQPHENANNGTLSILLASRFTVTITGDSLKDAGVMQWAAESIDLKKLAALK